MTSVDERRAELRRALGWALVGGLTIAAVTASFALVTGSLEEEEWRVIGTSLGFAVFSALGAAGASLRLRGGELLGTVTVVLAALAFLLLLVAVWLADDGEGIWRAWGCVSLAALAGSHASLVTSARRPTDTDAVSALVSISIGLAVIDALAGILPLADLVDDVDEAVVNIVGVLVIGLVLTTVLPPILRRLQRPDATARPTAPLQAAPDAPAREWGLAAEVLDTADRIAQLANGDAQLRAECERLRSLARSAVR